MLRNFDKVINAPGWDAKIGLQSTRQTNPTVST